MPSTKGIEQFAISPEPRVVGLDAEALPQYLRDTKLNKLRVDCSPSLLKLIASQDDSSEWGKIKHVQQLKAYGRTSGGDEDDRHIYYTKEPYSFDVDLGESTGVVSIIFYFSVVL
jgi:hypothetical protein